MSVALPFVEIHVLPTKYIILTFNSPYLLQRINLPIRVALSRHIFQTLRTDVMITEKLSAMDPLFACCAEVSHKSSNCEIPETTTETIHLIHVPVLDGSLRRRSKFLKPQKIPAIWKPVKKFHPQLTL